MDAAYAFLHRVKETGTVNVRSKQLFGSVHFINKLAGGNRQFRINTGYALAHCIRLLPRSTE